jgi:hypothetical protein
MHSDEMDKRQRAARCASELAAAPDASAEDYLLAAGCLEVVGDDRAAVALVKEALSVWPARPEVRTYARGLATRAGMPELRVVIDQGTEGHRQP